MERIIVCNLLKDLLLSASCFPSGGSCYRFMSSKERQTKPSEDIDSAPSLTISALKMMKDPKVGKLMDWIFIPVVNVLGV